MCSQPVENGKEWLLFIPAVFVMCLIAAFIPDACRYRIFSKLVICFGIIGTVIPCGSQIFSKCLYIVWRNCCEFDRIINTPSVGCGSHMHAPNRCLVHS